MGLGNDFRPMFDSLPRLADRFGERLFLIVVAPLPVVVQLDEMSQSAPGAEQLAFGVHPLNFGGQQLGHAVNVLESRKNKFKAETMRPEALSLFRLQLPRPQPFRGLPPSQSPAINIERPVAKSCDERHCAKVNMSSEHAGQDRGAREVRADVLTTVAALLASTAICHAGPCTAQIAQVERQAAQLQADASPSGAGEPSAPQSLGAQLHHQPTPGSIESAEKKASGDAAAALEQARKADAVGDAVGCTKALDQARQIYGIE